MVTKLSSDISVCGWNIVSLSALSNKKDNYPGLDNHLRSFDILCLTETKTKSDIQLRDGLSKFGISEKSGYYILGSHCKETVYSGSAIASKIKPINVYVGFDLNSDKDKIESKLNSNFKDDEGRIVTFEFETFYLVSVYVPNAGVDLKRLDWKILEWGKHFEIFIERLSKLKSLGQTEEIKPLGQSEKQNVSQNVSQTKPFKKVVIVGDLNVARQRFLDVHKGVKEDQPGFTPQERYWFEELLKRQNLHDTFREKNPNLIKYSFFTRLRKDAEEKNSGWRLDYVLSNDLSIIKHSDINTSVHGSDHKPVEALIIIT
jgi:exodeoxyribonuclease-3